MQGPPLKALTGVDHNADLAAKALRRLEALRAEQKDKDTAESACHVSPAAQQVLAPLLGSCTRGAAAPAKRDATVLLADIIEGAKNPGTALSSSFHPSTSSSAALLLG